MILFWCLIGLLLLISLGFILFPFIGKQHKFPIVMLVIASVFSSCALLLYHHWGDANGLAEYINFSRHKKQIEQEIKHFKSPQALITRMETIMRQRPNDARGWFLLGRLYFATDQYAKAEQAFSKANLLKPQQPGIMLQLAEASFFQHEKKLTPQARQLVEKVLTKQPNQLVAKNLLALDAYSRKNYQQAIDIWENLLQQLDPRSAIGKSLLASIADAQKKLHHAQNLRHDQTNPDQADFTSASNQFTLKPVENGIVE
ncbi:MAG: tetratricopeptide repeat protein [Pseudomonadota bacterium]